MRLADLVTTSQHVARTSGRLEKIGLLAALLGRVAPAEVEIATAFLCGVLRQAKLGVGYASVHADRKSTRLNSSHSQISYAVFCLQKKKKYAHRLPSDVRAVTARMVDWLGIRAVPRAPARHCGAACATFGRASGCHRVRRDQVRRA